MAIASAAIEDSKVRADDLRLAVKLAIVPRSKVALSVPQEDMMPPPPPPPSKSPQPEAKTDDTAKDKDEEEKEDEKEEEQEQDQEEEEQEEEDDGESAGTGHFASKTATLPTLSTLPYLPEASVTFPLVHSARGVHVRGGGGQFRGGNDEIRRKTEDGQGMACPYECSPLSAYCFDTQGGKSGIILSRDRGRYIRPVVPKDGAPTRVAIDATLREAAKNQVGRRAAAKLMGKDPSKIYLEPSDVRGKLMARRAGQLIVPYTESKIITFCSVESL